ncbi:MAG: hypothetical protein ACHQQS_04210 [Thermoanaerobaculales bacterium]
MRSVPELHVVRWRRHAPRLELGLWWVAGAAIVLAAWRTLMAVPMSHDVAFFYFVSGRMLDGAKLYRDILEINPPLVYYLGVPPAWLARTLGLESIPVFYGYCLVIAGGALALLWSVARRTAVFSAAAVRRVALLAVLCIELIMVIGCGMFNQFGQREHLALVLTLPYFLTASAAAAGRPVGFGLGIAAGTFAGVGMAFKPFFLAPWVLTEAYVAFRARSWRRVARPESVAVAATSLILAVLLLTLEPGYLANARSNLAVRPGLIGPFSALLLRPEVLVWLLAGLALLMLRLGPADDDLGRILFLAAGGFLIAALAQQHGMDYHYYPVLALAAFLLVVRCARWLEAWLSLRWRQAWGWLASLLGIAILVTGVLESIHLPRTMQRPQITKLAALISEHARDGSVYQLASTVDPLFPAVNLAHGRWLGHFNLMSTWLSPYLVRDPSLPRYNKPEAMNEVEHMVFQTVLDDLRRDPPELLVVETSDCKFRLPCKRFDFIEYFGQAKQFRELMGRYHLLRQLTPSAGFQYAVYLRVR